MTQVEFSVSKSTDEIDPGVHHCDASVFPDDTQWYSLFEKYATNSSLEIRFFQAIDNDSKLRTVLPLLRKQNNWGGVTLASMQNYYSVDFRPLCNTHHARKLIEPIIAELIRTEAPDVLQLQPLDSDAPETVLLNTAIKNQGWWIYQTISHVNWIHNLSGDYEDYIRTRPGKLRSTLRRKSKKIMALSGFQMSIHDGRTDLDELLKAYRMIYDRSWKVAEPNDQFIPALISAMAKKGHLRLGLLKISNRPVAAHFWIVKQGHAYIYKLAHDTEYDQYSPGTVLMAEMVRYVMDHDSVTRLDFMTGDDIYKRDWMTERRTKQSLIAYNPRSFYGNATHIFEEYAKPVVTQLTRLWNSPRLTARTADNSA